MLISGYSKIIEIDVNNNKYEVTQLEGTSSIKVEKVMKMYDVKEMSWLFK